MFPARPDLSPGQVVRLIEGNAVAGCREWARWDGLQFHDDLDRSWTFSDVPCFVFNGVLAARFPAEEAPERITTALAPFRERSLPLAWWVGPGSSPPDLPRLLEAEGLFLAAEIVGMAADLRQLPAANLPEGFTVEEVRDAEGLRVWTDLCFLVFEFPEGARDAWRDLHAALGLGPGRAWRHFLGRREGEPVAAASLFAGEAAASPANVATVPEMRRRGLGREMTLATLAEARTLGYQVSTLCSSEMGEGVYRGLGYEESCRLRLYLSG